MLDPLARRLIDPPLKALGGRLARAGIAADQITFVGLLVGLAAVPALAAEQYALALALILLNRLADGLDGAVARQRGPTDWGGYFDIVADFIFYGAVVLGFALADARNGAAAAFLLASFMGTSASFLAYAILAAKRGLQSEARGAKGFYHLGGLTEGTETILFFCAFCLWPGWFPALATLFGAMCWLTTAGRIHAAWRDFRPRA